MANIICPSCGAAGRIPDNFIGRRIKCPKCQEPFTATAGPAAPAPSKGVKGPAQPPQPPAKTAPPAAVRRRPPAADAAPPAPPPAQPTAPPPSSVARRRTPPPPPPPADEDVLEEVADEELAEADAELLDDEVGAGPQKGRVPAVGSVDYMRPFRFVFAKPTWLKNAFITGLCGLIPVVGPLCVMGYGYEVTATLHRKGRDTSYPDFDFGRFGAYLMRGLWPLLLGLIVYFAVMIPLWGIFLILQILLWRYVPAIFFSLLSLGLLAVFVLVMFLLVPMALRTGLCQGIDLTASVRFARDFLKRVGGPMILGLLVVGFLGGLINMVGMLLCCVGTIVTSPIVTLASANLLYQLYELYLARGGEPVPVKE